jgi:hypothetical protein
MKEGFVVVCMRYDHKAFQGKEEEASAEDGNRPSDDCPLTCSSVVVLQLYRRGIQRFLQYRATLLTRSTVLKT